jgi:hypothetical protein
MIDPSEEVRNLAMKFEAVKVSMSQDKSGIILRLSVHPDDCPSQLHTDWVGSRYIVAMVKLDDDDKPAIDEKTARAITAVKKAGMLPRNDAFQRFLSADPKIDAGIDPSADPSDREEAAAEALRGVLGVSSRSDIRSSPEAIQRLQELINDFIMWRNDNQDQAKAEKRS